MVWRPSVLSGLVLVSEKTQSMLPPRLPDTLEFAVRAQIRDAMAGEPAIVGEFAARMLDRLSPPNWTLEWSLPGWLGASLGLPPPMVVDLTLANVFGLAYIKLQDDLIDHEIGDGDRPCALLLSTALHRQWLLVYARLLPGESCFWDRFESYMAQWAEATLKSRQPWSRSFTAWTAEDFLDLGHRGAPLKSCAAAACVLVGQEGLMPQLETLLDHLLIGAVLLDHAIDWSDDLAQGHYNAFVAYGSSLPQDPQYHDAHRRAVLQELTVGPAGEPYFRLLRRELVKAQGLARQSGCDDLAGYLSWLERAAMSYRKELVIAARERLHQVVGPLIRSVETT